MLSLLTLYRRVVRGLDDLEIPLVLGFRDRELLRLDALEVRREIGVDALRRPPGAQVASPGLALLALLVGESVRHTSATAVDDLDALGVGPGLPVLAAGRVAQRAVQTLGEVVLPDVLAAGPLPDLLRRAPDRAVPLGHERRVVAAVLQRDRIDRAAQRVDVLRAVCRPFALRPVSGCTALM
ncbi:hypothetical protein OK352_11095 [Microbacterium sp. MPKO10]|nr:hypothetical protein [Microbacterium sp. MPKO10]MCW4458796.1 hypothetical protein [Microbacterium sp. MPKO10]